MRNRITKNLENGNYQKKIDTPSIEAYQNKNGWIDYYLNDNVIFSHRKNDYKIGAFSERLHLHDYYELTIALSSKDVEFIADDKIINVNKGVAILTKPNKFHMFRLSRATHYDRFVIYFKNINSLFPDNSIMDFANKGNSSCAIFNLTDKELNERIFNIEKALKEESTYKLSKAYLALCNLFLTLSDRENQDKIESENIVPHFIHEIKEHVDSNYINITSVEELAKKFFYSREYLSRSFRKYYNTPLYDYILERKIRHCANLLDNGESVENASKNAGFTNTSSFIKIFKKHYNQTPSEYKKKAMKS